MIVFTPNRTGQYSFFESGSMRLVLIVVFTGEDAGRKGSFRFENVSCSRSISCLVSERNCKVNDFFSLDFLYLFSKVFCKK